MKTFRLFSLLLLSMLSAVASAQHHQHDKSNVVVLSYEQVDEQACPMAQSMARQSMVADMAREDFTATRREGFQQLHNPLMIFTTKNNRFSLGIGGEINFRTSYDMRVRWITSTLSLTIYLWRRPMLRVSV